MRTNWFAIWQVAMSGLSFVTSGTMLADVVDKRTGAILVLISGGLAAATASYASLVKVTGNYPPEVKT